MIRRLILDRLCQWSDENPEKVQAIIYSSITVTVLSGIYFFLIYLWHIARGVG